MFTTDPGCQVLIFGQIKLLGSVLNHFLHIKLLYLKEQIHKSSIVNKNQDLLSAYF